KATGAAMSRGHGVASTSTSAKRAGSPETSHATPARASENTVNGTAKRSASRTTGAWLADAAATSATICWYWLSAATAVARSSTASTPLTEPERDRKSTRLNSSHVKISY